MTNLIDMRTSVKNWEFPILFITETVSGHLMIFFFFCLRNLITFQSPKSFFLDKDVVICHKGKYNSVFSV